MALFGDVLKDNVQLGMGAMEEQCTSLGDNALGIGTLGEQRSHPVDGVG